MGFLEDKIQQPPLVNGLTCHHPPPFNGPNGCPTPKPGATFYPPVWTQTGTARPNDIKFISNVSHATDVTPLFKGLAKHHSAINFEWDDAQPPNYVNLNTETGVITYDPTQNPSNQGVPPGEYKVHCSLTTVFKRTRYRKSFIVTLHLEVEQVVRQPEPDDPPVGDDPSDPSTNGNDPDHPDSGNDGGHGGSNDPVTTPPDTNANPACKIFTGFLSKEPSDTDTQINATEKVAKTFIPVYPGVYEIHQSTLADSISLKQKPITRANSVFTARYKRSVYAVPSTVPDAFKLSTSTGTVSFIGNFDEQFAVKAERSITVHGTHHYARSDGSTFTVFTTTPLTIKLINPDVTANKPIATSATSTGANVTTEYTDHAGLVWWIYMLIAIAVLIVTALTVYFIRRRAKYIT